ncbi:MAG: hypothetical protein K9M02_09725 [Thiohalocapsa sp.]|nr:hypothetical protein [Thiohalocapsa sp.]
MMKRYRAAVIPSITFVAGLLVGAVAFSSPRVPDASGEAPDSQPQMPASTPSAATDAGDSAAKSAASVTSISDDADALPSDAAPREAEAGSELRRRIEELASGWGRMEAELATLRQRVAVLERRDSTTVSGTQPEQAPAGATTPESRREALVRAGVAGDLADDLLWRTSQLSLQRLELRDEAMRDGWFGTERYRQELRRINQEQVSWRDSLGADAYDRYLFESGSNNRVQVDAVIPGSAGDDSGILPGDIIERYADARVLDYDDLRSATSDGQRGELVPVAVRRGGELLELWLPRGPIGVQLESTRAEPAP